MQASIRYIFAKCTRSCMEPLQAALNTLYVPTLIAGATSMDQDQGPHQEAGAGSPNGAGKVERETTTSPTSAPTARALFGKAASDASGNHRPQQHQALARALAASPPPAGKASSPTAAILMRMMSHPTQPAIRSSTGSPSPPPPAAAAAGASHTHNPLKTNSMSPAIQSGSKLKHGSRRASMGQSPPQPASTQHQQQPADTPPLAAQEEFNITLCPIQQQLSSVALWRAHQSGRRSGSPLAEDQHLLHQQQQQQQARSPQGGGQNMSSSLPFPSSLPPPPIGSGLTASPSSLAPLPRPRTLSTPIVTLVGTDRHGATTPGSSCQHPSPPVSGARQSSSPHSKAWSPHSAGKGSAPGPRINSGTPSASHPVQHSSRPSSQSKHQMQQQQQQPLTLAKPGVLAAIERVGTRGLTARQLGQKLGILSGEV
jgi:hypothetical protein